MLSFTIFGIPVRVLPFFWIVPLFVSGALSMQPGPAMLQRAAIYTVVIFLSILVHELGHALTGLKFGGGAAAIELNGFGGLAYNTGGRFDLKSRRLMIAMGPGAGFLLLALTIISMMAIYGFESGLGLASTLLFGKYSPLSLPLDLKIFSNPGLLILFSSLLFVNFWWGILNLLPIMPLDGGQLYESFSKSPRMVFRVGVITAVIVALFALTRGEIFLVMLMGFLGVNNYQAMQQARY